MTEAELGKVERANEALDRADRIVRSDIVFNPGRKQTGLMPALAGLERAIRHKPNRTPTLQIASSCPASTGKSSARFGDGLSSPFCKNILIFRRRKSVYIHHRPVPQRGGSRSSRTRDRMRWTQAAPKTRALNCGRQNRVVLTPRRWRQVGGKKFPPATVTKKPDRRGEYDISRKPLRGECRVFPGVT